MTVKSTILSIITINLNNATGLIKTLESVVNQNFTDFEYIIIDGGSIDGSVELIKEYAKKISFWMTEPDKGIYNAMNKGILKATGEYCLFLNSGDWLVDENVVFDFIKHTYSEDIVAGNIHTIDESGNYKIYESPNDLTLDFFYFANLPHQATFIKRELFQKFGLYDEDYKILSDTDFIIRALSCPGCSYKHFDRVVSHFDTNGISSQQSLNEIAKDERESILNKSPLIHRSFKKILTENTILNSHEKEYHEYLNLKNGKAGFIIRFLLYIKKIRKYTSDH